MTAKEFEQLLADPNSGVKYTMISSCRYVEAQPRGDSGAESEEKYDREAPKPPPISINRVAHNSAPGAGEEGGLLPKEERGPRR